jgi:hypothetical protein
MGPVSPLTIGPVGEDKDGGEDDITAGGDDEVTAGGDAPRREGFSTFGGRGKYVYNPIVAFPC